MNREIRDLIPATANYAYLNSAAVGPLPTTAIAAVNDQLNDVSAHGSINFPHWIEIKENCRTLMSSMLGVEREHLAFDQNTSVGIASIAAGIDWRSGDNIVSFANEFPANFYGWRSVRNEYDVELRMCEERNGRLDTDEIISLMDSRTRVVAVSAIQFASGFAADLERIGKAVRAVDALFVIDTIQALGARSYDLPALYVDAACGASHKWLCGPEGVGYIYLSDRARERITPKAIGWISVPEPWDFDDREQPLRPNALAWEAGTGPSALFYGLEASLKLLTNIGLDKIGSHIRDLSNELCERLRPLNYEMISSRVPDEATGIVCIKHLGGLTSNDVAKTLYNAGVIVSPRGDRLRIATHFFNTSDDLDRLFDALPS